MRYKIYIRDVPLIDVNKPVKSFDELTQVFAKDGYKTRQKAEQIIEKNRTNEPINYVIISSIGAVSSA